VSQLAPVASLADSARFARARRSCAVAPPPFLCWVSTAVLVLLLLLITFFLALDLYSLGLSGATSWHVPEAKLVGLVAMK
jgi:hypothetical protein